MTTALFSKALRPAVVAVAGLTALPALAADLPSRVAPPVAPVVAPIDTFQPFQVRVRAVGIITDKGGSLNTTGGAYVSNGIKTSNAVIPELDISYYFTRNISAELVCCVSNHAIYANGGALNGSQVGRTWVFPPTLLAQYHFMDWGRFQPYVGVGVNYTHYFSTSTTGALSYLNVKDSWGVAGQVGFDYMVDEHWGFNVDAKKIMMQPSLAANTTGGVALAGRGDINPWLVGAGITYRFGGGSASPIVARY